MLKAESLFLQLFVDIFTFKSRFVDPHIFPDPGRKKLRIQRIRIPSTNRIHMNRRMLWDLYFLNHNGMFYDTCIQLFYVIFKNFDVFTYITSWSVRRWPWKFYELFFKIYFWKKKGFLSYVTKGTHDFPQIMLANSI